MAPSNALFQNGDLVWVAADKMDLSQDEVGIVVSSALCDYTDPYTGDTKQEGLVIKLKISNTRLVFPTRRLRPFDSTSDVSAGPDEVPSAAASRPKRRSTRNASRGVTPSPVLSLGPVDQDNDRTTPSPSPCSVGSEVSKEFDGVSYSGTVTSYNNKSKYFRVKYEDGDEEEMAKDEIQKYLVVTSSTKEDSSSSSSSNNTSKETKPAVTRKRKSATTTTKKKTPPKKENAKATTTKTRKTKAPVVSKKAKATASKKSKASAKNLLVAESSEDEEKKSEDDDLLIDLKTKKKKTPSKKTKAAAAKTTPKKAKKQNKGVDPNRQGALIHASDTDSDDERDRPFRVEYSSSGRATCKSCDEKILKGVLRIASRPLFRGKPGFVVYRHLTCQILPEEITKVSDVGGWRRLGEEDRALLQKQLEESKLRIEEENQEMDADELVQKAFQGEMRKPPPGLSATLLPFQREGVSWMYHQELSEVGGGILADEMGMGKTIQTITTILDNRPKLQHAKPGAKHPPCAPDLKERLREESKWNEALESCHHDLKMADVPKQVLKATSKKNPIGVRAGTLVVCPLIALYQWKEEIEKFTDTNALTICIYHGTDRQEKFPREVLSKYDIVLTTYQVLEADFRKMVSPNKVKCPNCNRSFKIDKLKVHLLYFCGETAQRTVAQARQYRSTDRQEGRSNKRKGGTSSKEKTEKSFSKTPSNKVTTKQNSKSLKNTKKVTRATQTKGYESDSDLSLPDDFDVSSKRPSRSAARAATLRLSASSKEWGGDNASDSDEFSDMGSVISSDDDTSDETSTPPRTTVVKKRHSAKNHIDDVSSSDDSSSEDDAALVRAKKRQKLALSRAHPGKKKFPGEKKKSFPGKKTKNKRQSNDSSSDEELVDTADPLKGIDLEALKQKAMEGCQVSVLHTMSWWRIVLDEAHVIKSRSSSTSSAAFHLTAINRWALSGTPLQNRVGELYSLIRFLRIDPMAHYFCRREGCDCKSIYYRMFNGKCKDCGCASSQHFSHFNKHVLNVIQREGYTGDGRRAMMKLKTEVLDKCLLRRTKETRAEDMNLPPRHVIIKPIRLHPREEDFYNALYTQTKSSFDDYVAEGTLLNNYAHIFDLLTKMRQAVDHPYMIVHSKKNHNKIQQQAGPAVANGSTDCEICDETPTDRVLSACCKSAFCRSCVIDMMTLADVQQGSTRCPCCRAPFSIDLSQESQQVVDDGTLAVNDTAGMPSLKEMRNVATGSILRRINLAEFSTSTKLEALVQELYEMRKHRSGSKALVFSQFTSMLDLCRWRLNSDPCLQDLGLGVRIVHGGMNVQSRDESLKAFKEDPSVRVLLMSLKAGGVALNLTVANEAYLLDPWWNPAAEMQAIDRTHRLGQYRPIRAVRFIAEGTVEERVLQLQEKKRLVFDGTVGRDAASLKMLTVDDMKALFT